MTLCLATFYETSVFLYERDKPALDKAVPRLAYDRAAPTTFCWNNLIRRLVIDGKAYVWKKGDSADFCHALIGAAYGQFTMLDKQWKQRVESLPKPNSLAKVCYEPELDRFVDDVEAAVAQSPYLRHPVVAAINGLDP